MVQDVDKDGNKKVSFEEFKQMERVSRLPAEHQKKLFDRLDKDGDGSISRREVPSPSKMVRGGRERDLDGDGRISFEEFAKGPHLADVPDERKREIFKRVDRNNDGFLDRRDWKGRPGGGRPGPGEGGPGRPGPPGPEFSKLDEDGDGVLGFEEFRKLPGVNRLGEDEQEDRFESLDKNGDGKVQREEMAEMRRDRGPRRGGEPRKTPPGEGRKPAPSPDA